MVNKRQLQLGILYLSFPGWTAYNNYLSNLISALRTLEDPPLIYFIHKKGVNIDLSLEQVDGTIEIPNLVNFSNKFPRFVNKVINKIIDLINPSLIDRICSNHHIDILFSHCIFIPTKHHRIPVVSWIPDFQHLHYPQMFPVEDIAYRNWVFRQVIDKSDLILVSSQAVRNDLNNFSKKEVSNVKVLPFCVQIDPSIYEHKPEEICTKYSLPKKFFYLPNQFWIHKNHTIVLNALNLIHETHPEIIVVCSGGISDYRNNNFFSDILRTVSVENLRDNFIILGLLPYEDVHLLMRQSCAVLQPSLFEGWSTTVEEAKSLGKSILLSDIPVHREQNPFSSFYFNPTDAAELARQMILVSEKTIAGPSFDLEEISRKELPLRMHQYGTNFMNVISVGKNLMANHYSSRDQ